MVSGVRNSEVRVGDTKWECIESDRKLQTYKIISKNKKGNTIVIYRNSEKKSALN